ncbi:MAG: hypothetical protein AAF628_18265 [Planctomycetota bacterium]
MGSLCDKLAIVELKRWHTSSASRLQVLDKQASQLSDEIDAHVCDSVSGAIQPDRLRFPSNKVFDIGDRTLQAVEGGLGHVIGELARINCALWHEQEKVYEVQKSPETHHDAVQILERLGQLNLERTQCIDAIDEGFLNTLQTNEQNS